MSLIIQGKELITIVNLMNKKYKDIPVYSLAQIKRLLSIININVEIPEYSFTEEIKAEKIEIYFENLNNNLKNIKEIEINENFIDSFILREPILFKKFFKSVEQESKTQILDVILSLYYEHNIIRLLSSITSLLSNKLYEPKTTNEIEMIDGFIEHLSYQAKINKNIDQYLEKEYLQVLEFLNSDCSKKLIKKPNEFLSLFIQYRKNISNANHKLYERIIDDWKNKDLGDFESKYPATKDFFTNKNDVGLYKTYTPDQVIYTLNINSLSREYECKSNRMALNINNSMKALEKSSMVFMKYKYSRKIGVLSVIKNEEIFIDKFIHEILLLKEQNLFESEVKKLLLKMRIDEKLENKTIKFNTRKI